MQRECKMQMRRLLLLATVFLGCATHAFAQNWPTRPIKLIVATGPGAATDVIARLLANEVSKTLGSVMFVENIPGASGILAHKAAASAAPDGHTLLFSNTSGLAMNPTTFKTLPYDPTKDFTAVATVADFAPQIVSVHKSVPARNLTELIAYVKANPGKISYGVDATAGAGVFAGRLLNRRAQLDMAEVPYRTASQLVQDAATGRIQVLISSVIAAQPFVQTGDIRQIAVFSGRRFPGLPDLPTADETIPGTILDGWFVVVAPSGTPASIVERVNRAVAEFTNKDETRQRLIALGIATSGTGTPATTGEFVRKEQEKWRSLAMELDVQPQ